MPDLHEPVVTLEGVKILAFHIASLDLEVKLRVQNPNSITATLRELPFTVFFRAGGHPVEIASGNTGRVEIDAYSSSEINVPVTTYNLVLIEALASLVEKGGVQLEIKGNAVIDHILAGWTLPFSKTVDVTEHEILDAVLGKNKGEQS
ncbi:MAG: LEA type 2 family protein [Methanoregula sp.]|nr:LEA type 2 family protein [Methanoregula sp.]